MAATPGRVLRGVETHLAEDTVHVRILFDRPIRYRRHSPARTGRILQVSLQEVTTSSAANRETLVASWPERVPISEIAFERGAAGARLEVRFSRRVEFRVKPGRDLRSVTLEIAREPTKASRSSTPPPPTAASRIDSADDALPAATDEAKRHYQAARDALRDGEIDRAIGHLTHVTTLPASDLQPAARELLGVAYERKGQLAHARAEYAAYLLEHPKGEASDRVRQRIAALETRSDIERDPLRSARADTTRPPEVRGSTATTWHKSRRKTDAHGRVTTDDSLFSDLFLRSSWQGRHIGLRSEMAAGYLYDLRPDRDDRLRVNTAFVEADALDAGHGLGLGRQPGNERGLGSRFDGLRVTAALGSDQSVTLLAGFPAEPAVDNGVDTGRQLVGLSLDARDVGIEGFEMQLFGLHQRVGSQTDRSAVGAELRLVRERFFSVGIVDWDLHFGSLNAAVVTGNWAMASSTHLHFLAEHRNLPYLTTTNAVLGQVDQDLDDLRDRFTWREIESLAEDRTIRSKLVTTGWTHDLSERWQLAGDVTYSHLSGTPESGGVASFEGPGDQYSGSLQLVSTGLFRESDVVTFGVRYLVAEDVEIGSFLSQARMPLRRDLWLTPMVEISLRKPRARENAVVIRPGLRFDWRITRRFHLETEGSYEWWDGERFVGDGDEEAYSLLVSGRMDF